MKLTFPKSLLSIILIAPLVAQAQPPASLVVKSAAVPASPSVTLPLGRSTYFIGESVPLATASPTDLVELVDQRGAVIASKPAGDGRKVSGTAWRFETGRLAPGVYSIRINGIEARKVNLASAERRSAGAIFDEASPTVPGQDANDPKKVQLWHERFEQAFKETQVSGIIATGDDDGRRYGDLDNWARYGTSLWVNLYTRPLSFVGAQGWAPEMDSMTQRMAQVAQMNARYPNFGGIAYHWDPVGYKRGMLLIYWSWNQNREAITKYIGRSEKAIEDEFRKRTGLEPVTTSELMRYSAATGHPELGPAFDLPTAKWIDAISKHTPPLPPAERAALERRMDAWTHYLAGLMGESNAYHQKWLRQIGPGLVNTSSYDNEYTPREGSWQEKAYAPLDFRWVEAWSDQVDGPDYIYQWLFHAALAEMGRRPGQPVWVGSVLGAAHNAAPYPGRFSRAVAQNFAYGGRGMGFALEGFSNVLGGMGTTQWWNIRDTAGGEDLRMGREWLQRFAPLEEQSRPVRRVGVLLSLTQFSRQNVGMGFDTPLYNTFIALARLGYTPRFVSEEDVATGGLQGFGALVIINQTASLPAAVLEKLQSFQADGGKVLLSKNSTAAIPGATALEVTEPFKRPGKSFNYAVPNVSDFPTSMLQEIRFTDLAPTFHAALGDELRTPLVPTGDAKSRISTFALGGGEDADYVIATNDSFYDNQSTWSRQEVVMQPNKVRVGAVLYDLSDEKYLGSVAPVRAGFLDRTARLYGLLSRPVEKLDVRATQKITAGDAIAVSVAFLDKQSKPLRAAIPFSVTLSTPDGALFQQYDRATSQDGAFAMQIPTAANAGAGRWLLAVHSMLDGKTLKLPVEVRAGRANPEVLTRLGAPVVARGDFAALWKSTSSLVAPIFDGPDRAERLAAAQTARDVLAARGVKIEIVEAPTISTYFLTYDPTPEQIAENARAEKGESFGQIKRLTTNGNDYFAPHSGFVYGRPVVLFDMVPQKDNAMAERLDDAGMLWPQATASFPGVGRATIQIVKSGFKLGQDAVIVQAADAAGLLAGAKALAAPPADWITPGVEAARVQLARGLSIGRTPDEATSIAGAIKAKLTGSGAQSSIAPSPLALNLKEGALPPLRGEAKMATLNPPAPRAAADVPAKLEIAKVALPLIKIDERWQRRIGPDGDWTGDLRFSEATSLKLRTPVAGRYKMSLGGLFRFSDRRPATQPTWEEFVDLYMQTVQPKRQPMSFDVLLDGNPLGSLADVATGERDVATEFSTQKTIMAKEEAGVAISGVLDLPAGEHELVLVPHNIVDGKLQTVEVTPA